jgi:hypothetical protein
VPGGVSPARIDPIGCPNIRDMRLLNIPILTEVRFCGNKWMSLLPTFVNPNTVANSAAYTGLKPDFAWRLLFWLGLFTSDLHSTERQRVTDLYPISPPKSELAQTVLPSSLFSLQRC